jgi:hypothetical protein
VQSVPATTGLYVIPPGWGEFYTPTAGLFLQKFIAASSGGAGTWTTIYTTAANDYRPFRSDGVTTRFSNTTAGAITVTMLRFR